MIAPDGTTIAFDRLGDGPPLILVGGATCDRAMQSHPPNALSDVSVAM